MQSIRSGIWLARFKNSTAIIDVEVSYSQKRQCFMVRFPKRPGSNIIQIFFPISISPVIPFRYKGKKRDEKIFPPLPQKNDIPLARF